jgi:predicted DNA-binding transcriptional regulator YafY
MLDDAEPPDADGWRTVRLLLESEEVATGQLTGLGEGVAVIEPLSLRQRLHAVGLRMAELNSVAPGPE